MKVTFWISFILFIIIQTMDMMLTERYVGNHWQYETFPIMSWMIKTYGINVSLWICRVSSYLYLFFCLMNQESKWVVNLLVIATIMYWMSMIGWIFTTNLAAWPLPI